MNCGYELKKKWSSQWTQFMQLRKKPEKKKFRTSTGFEPVYWRYRCDAYQLSYEATDVGRRSIVGSYVPVKEMSVNYIWKKSYMNPQLTCSQSQWLHSSVGRASHPCREVTVWKPVEVLNFFQASLRSCINCFHCDDHFFFKKIFVHTFLTSLMKEIR